MKIYLPTFSTLEMEQTLNSNTPFLPPKRRKRCLILKAVADQTLSKLVSNDLIYYDSSDIILLSVPHTHK